MQCQVSPFVTLFMSKKKRNEPKKLRDPWSTGQKVAFGIFLALLILVIIPAGVLIYFGLQGKDTFTNGTSFTYEGTTYTLGEDVVTILVMGIDNSEYEGTTTTTEDEEEKFHVDDEIMYIDQDGAKYITKGGRVDMCFLFVLDKSAGEMYTININRDAMTEVDICSTSGQVYLTDTMQLTLAYAYGDGATVSCENFAKAVSNMMGGLPIDKYIALDMEAFADINDAVGGASVLPTTTLSADIFQYESITLAGDQAVTYLEKMSITDRVSGTHQDRMERQSQYLVAFMRSLISSCNMSLSTLKDVYEAAEPYMITNITANDLIYLAYLSFGVDFTLDQVDIMSGQYTRVGSFDQLTDYQESISTFLDKHFK